MNDRESKRALSVFSERFLRGGISRRDFLRKCAQLGLGFSAAAYASLTGRRPTAYRASAFADEISSTETTKNWLQDIGRALKGSTVRVVTETTAPSFILKSLTQREFTPLTGIDVQIELLPLERVLQRTSLDIAGQTSRYDIYYLDQSWIARFADDTSDLREIYQNKPDLAMPGYDWDDFLPSLVDGISTYRDKLVGVPFDIPVFIMFYRQDLFDELELSVPQNLVEYLQVVQTIQASKAPRIYGTVGQMKTGHYSLNCEWTAWLWAHGGSIFDNKGLFSGGDEQGMEGLDYLLKLHKNMPPYVNTWTWDGQTQALLQGLAGITLTWAEIFPALDDKRYSLIPGLMQASIPPKATMLRPPAECGFGEKPNIGHQGGSALALSRYSQSTEAAAIFLQWATSSDVQTRASLLGGGASPTRISVFEDPRIAEAAKIRAGTTRHFNAVRQTIETAMGSEPDIPVWPEISNAVIPRELGRLFTGEQDSSVKTMAAIKQKVDAMTAPYRS